MAVEKPSESPSKLKSGVEINRVLLTGAGGFVGCHMLRHLLMNTNWQIICPVTFRHRGNGDRIASSIEDNLEYQKRVDVVMCDLSAPISVTTINRFGEIDAVLNIASESHVDRSIAEPVGFIRNNVDLMLNLLEYARVVKPKVFLHMSTDEVFGETDGDHPHMEWDPLIPSNPYSASKAAQEEICIAYWRTYNVPLILTNTMNMFGEMQDVEKYFTKVIRHLQRNEPVTVHVDRAGVLGSRCYLHARNFADAWLYLLENVTASPVGVTNRPDRYNISGDKEVDNLEFAKMIAIAMDIAEPQFDLVDFEALRPGHDLKYALDASKIAALGWKAPVQFEQSLTKAVRWTLEHPEWLEI
jgi:dTDP-glucose 4,6-dehydratase